MGIINSILAISKREFQIIYRNISFVVLILFKLIPQIHGKYSNNIPWGLSYRDAKRNFFIIDIFI